MNDTIEFESSLNEVTPQEKRYRHLFVGIELNILD
ncbi:unnamed protein product (macronuclear) [Paramecium tetraurelia]|uniref:Uncharacterized protein n=1 Tax=Paramecium tetraurelia TaxID=5888 RepID=A0EBY0_PARTE|nr:uncharacterized protein GSPATT00025532001 [Paramecium tetraurelia]CAK92797.1 unnamed protein product [Paramecium tetraurelia]|eukprot:XP_001460194.1 hypothetical protein (macronuclear) [Paramecium tetraurelia strain d4-2]